MLHLSDDNLTKWARLAMLQPRYYAYKVESKVIAWHSYRPLGDRLETYDAVLRRLLLLAVIRSARCGAFDLETVIADLRYNIVICVLEGRRVHALASGNEGFRMILRSILKS